MTLTIAPGVVELPTRDQARWIAANAAKLLGFLRLRRFHYMLRVK
jgi:hypothetical protein